MVRAGAITPTIEDERFFREQIGLPSLTPEARAQWDSQPTRAPITLAKPKDEETAAP
jgi:hypothetical protein